MKVIKPLDIIGGNGLLYTNALNTVASWSSVLVYLPSTIESRTVVWYQGEFWECLRRNQNSAPTSLNQNWTSLGAEISELPVSAPVLTWSSSVTYGTGIVVLYNNNYYESLQGSNTNNPPDSASTVWWGLITISNSRGQFDNQVSTKTSGNRILTATVESPKINAASLVNPQGRRAIITCKASAIDSGVWKVFNNNDAAGIEYDPTVTENLNALAYSPAINTLVAGGASGRIIYSTNAGKTWAAAITPSATVTIKDICYSFERDLFVAVGGTTMTTAGISFAWYSRDGITWTSATVNTTSNDYWLNSCIYVAEGLNKFVAGGRTQNGNIGIFFSEDGITWTRTAITAIIFDEINAVGFNIASKLLVLAGSGLSNGGKNCIYSQDYGVTWIQAAADPSKLYEVTSLTYIPKADGSGTFIATTSTPGILLLDRGDTSFRTVITATSGTIPLITFSKCIRIPTVSTGGFESKVIAFGGIQAIKFNLGNPTANQVESIDVSGATGSIVTAIYSLELDSIFGVGVSGLRFRNNISYNKSQTINTVYVGDWYDYFFGEYEQKNTLIFTNIPNYQNTKTTVTLVSDPEGLDYANKTVSSGVSLAGNEIILGTTQWGASAGIIDYSKKETDDFGVTTFVQRAFSKRMNVNLILPSADLTRIQNALINIRATPCVWISTSSDIYEVLVVYGFYRDFNLEIPYPEYSFCSLQIEGLT